MNRTLVPLLLLLCCAAPVLAQTTTTIGSSTCNSSTLNGSYEFLMSGRQVTSSGATSKLFQAVGTATFDGLSKVTLTLTANTVTTSLSFGSPLVYAGTYSMQTNCVGTINITSGDTATFTVEAYNSGKAFALIGSDTNYAYNGSGNVQPATCPVSISGAYEFNANGSTLSGSSVSGVLDVAGLLQFDGQGNVTANWTQAANLTPTTVAATGTYVVNSTCGAIATLTDASNNTYSVSFSLYTTTPDFALAVSSTQEIFDGGGSATLIPAGGTCSASVLNGTYETVLSGRVSPGGIPSKFSASEGIATFDGQSKVTFTLTANSINGTQMFGTPVVYSGTYSVQPNCQGSINLTSGDTATLAIVAFSFNTTTQTVRAFQMVGTDATYAYNGGGNVQPSACAVSTLSGTWPFSATGNSFAGATDTGVVDIAGVLQFDGQGNATASWMQASNTSSTTVSATGTFAITSGCVGTLNLTDTSNNNYAGTVSIFGAQSQSFGWVATNPQLVFTATARVASVNPGLAIVNAANSVANETPAGSIFSLYGVNLATGVGEPTKLPLPTTLRTTTVTVNGELAPLFYVDSGQINAQMPEDIAPGVATVIVKNGMATSNAAAVLVPATATPGIIVYGNNLAVVINPDGSTNSSSTPAKVGAVVVAYFLGGGPVMASGPLTTGAASPAGQSPVTGPYTITLGGVNAVVNYVGLTPGSVGLYQANFVVPQVTAGNHPLVLTIAGQASNSPVMSVSK
jgi:uncharacterized protein (TIGR03437 family)